MEIEVKKRAKGNERVVVTAFNGARVAIHEDKHGYLVVNCSTKFLIESCATNQIYLHCDPDD